MKITTSSTHRAVIGFGSNIDPARNVLLAVRILAGHTTLIAISTVYENPAAGAPGTPNYYNGVLELETSLTRDDLGVLLREIEADLGRMRTGDRNAPRPIDLDLIQYGGQLLEQIDAPHVAIPLLELRDANQPGVPTLPPSFIPLPELTTELRGLCSPASKQ